MIVAFGVRAPSRAMSRPLSAATTVTRTGFPGFAAMSTIRRMSGSLATIAATSTGHSSMATISFEPRRWKPRMTPFADLTAEKTARRRVAGWMATIGSTGASIPSRAKARTTAACFQAR